jgi:hypothetical protein
MNPMLPLKRWAIVMLTGLLAFGYALAQQAGPNPYLEGTAGPEQGPRGLTSYMPVAITESFSSLMARLSAEKPNAKQAHDSLLNERYDLSDRPAGEEQAEGRRGCHGVNSVTTRAHASD